MKTSKKNSQKSTHSNAKDQTLNALNELVNELPHTFEGEKPNYEQQQELTRIIEEFKSLRARYAAL